MAIELISEIVLKNNQTFPLIDANNIRGGFYQVNTILERDNIPSSRKKDGMLCFVKNDPDKIYTYLWTNDSWTKSKIGSGGVEVLDSLEDVQDYLKESGLLIYVKNKDLLYYYSNEDSWKSIGNIVYSDTAPDDLNAIWIDSSSFGDMINLENEYVSNLIKAILTLLLEVSELKALKEIGIVAGTSANSYRVDMVLEADPIAPDEIEEDEDMKDYPTYADESEPTVNHISIKLDTIENIKANWQNFIDGELVWATDISKLFIYYDGNPIMITGNSSSEGGSGGGGDVTSELLDKLETIGFITPNGKNYRIKINDNGELIVYNIVSDAQRPTPNNTAGNVYEDKLLYINSVYMGCLNDEHSYLPCSHNFVELANASKNDIELNGLYLLYAPKDNIWEKLPLWGTIKAGSTFLIRGALCSVMDVNTTLIKVKTYDMEWKDSKGELIKFNYLGTGDEQHAKFYLAWGDKTGNKILFYDANGTLQDNPGNNPYAPFLSGNSLPKGYIDLVGFGANADGYLQDRYTPNDNGNISIKLSSLLVRYYSLDPVSLANNATISSRKSSTYWDHVNLDKNLITNVSIENYTPKASFENKNIFFNKTLLSKTQPNMVNITFGRLATDNGSGATRCFNWVSVGYYDEYLWYRNTNTQTWTKVESYKIGGNTTSAPLCVKNYPEIYNRLRWETTDGTAVTSHKVIITGLSAGTYKYKIVRNDKYESEEFTFTVKSNVSEFSFILTSDQQGFKWNEYEVWRKSAEYINSHNTFDFTINTGDLTLNGNRVNEWMDYYNGRVNMRDKEEMMTIGNNDLCTVVPYTMGDGSDIDKVNHINARYYYTFEIDTNNPPIFNLENKSIFVDTLYSFNYGAYHFVCLNSEIATGTETSVYGLSASGKLYSLIEDWVKKDLQIFKGNTTDEPSNCGKCVVYCHEMPFTIVINSVYKAFKDTGYTKSGTGREGGNAWLNRNNDNKYRFSRLFKKWGIRLVFGGHKHTFSFSYPIYDAPGNYTPNTNHTGLMETVTAEDSLAPYILLTTSESNNLDAKDNHFYRKEIVNLVTAPVYVMCLATGYKHTSNKELPSAQIPYLRYFYPCINNDWDGKGSDSVNTGLRYPFYVRYDVTSNSITINAYYVTYIFTSGQFSINNLSTSSASLEQVALVSNSLKSYVINNL